MENYLRNIGTNKELFEAGYDKVKPIMDSLGFSSFRTGQWEIIRSLMSGTDTIGVLPTGSGKSLTFILPALIHDWQVVVFSPLIALMRDQVASLHEMGLKAAKLNSESTTAEVMSALDSWVKKKIQFLYVAPERLKDQQFQAIMEKLPPSFVVLDEAHTLSQWAPSFRPAYTKVGEFIKQYQPRVVGAFTATATDNICKDIKDVLFIPEAMLLDFSQSRPNLVQHNLSASNAEEARIMVRNLLKDSNESAIVYVPTQKDTETMKAFLDSQGVPATWYHADVPPTQKKSNQDDFMHGCIPVMVATNAFGMGIDKGDIRKVIFAGLPQNIEEYSQGIGRGGRDGETCLCYLIDTPDSRYMQELLYTKSNPTAEDVTSLYAYLKSRVNSKNTIAKTAEEMAKELPGVEINAAMGVLVRYKVVERSSPTAKIAHIKFLESGAENKKWQELLPVVRQEGLPTANDYYEVDLESLVRVFGKRLETIRAWIRDLVKINAIEFVPPFKGKVTTIIGDISLVDLDDVRKRTKLEAQRYRLVRELAGLPDAQMEDYVREYFKSGGLK